MYQAHRVPYQINIALLFLCVLCGLGLLSLRAADTNQIQREFLFNVAIATRDAFLASSPPRKTSVSCRYSDIEQEICDEFEAFAPPIPVELMLQQPNENMWEEIDVAQLSGSFLSIKERYSPRMSLARLLVRHIAASEWGKERGLDKILGDSELLNAFARMLLMPKEMILGLTTAMKTPQSISLRFEVPESDAKDRLIELA